MSNNDLIGHLKAKGILKTPRIISAFEHVDRAGFILEKYKGQVYEDRPLPIGYSQTISQPTTVAFMLELLQPQKGDKIMDVGSGSGWTTALLGYIVGERGYVYGVEKIPELVEFGFRNLVVCTEIKNATIVEAGENLGLPKKSPFDKILVSAAAKAFPNELVEQLVMGGCLVVPVGNSIFKVDKKPGGISKQEFPGFVFVPLV